MRLARCTRAGKLYLPRPVSGDALPPGLRGWSLARNLLMAWAVTRRPLCLRARRAGGRLGLRPGLRHDPQSPAARDARAGALRRRLRPHRRPGAARGPDRRVLSRGLPPRRHRELRQHRGSDAAPRPEPDSRRREREPRRPIRRDDEPDVRREPRRGARPSPVGPHRLVRHDLPGHSGQRRQHRQRRPDAVVHAERDRLVQQPAHRAPGALPAPLQRRDDPAVDRVARPHLRRHQGFARRADGVRALRSAARVPADRAHARRRPASHRVQRAARSLERGARALVGRLAAVQHVEGRLEREPNPGPGPGQRAAERAHRGVPRRALLRDAGPRPRRRSPSAPIRP